LGRRVARSYARRPGCEFALVLLGLIAGLTSSACAKDVDDPRAFGSSSMSESALIGIMYDLKQTPERQPTTVTPLNYFDIITEFLSKGWDESVLDRYYRVSRPLYTTQIFIPDMDANDAPKAFNAEATVKPSLWVIHYKGQISPPSPGTYRFWGSSDDMIAVAVNGKTELVYFLTIPKGAPPVWVRSDPEGIRAADCVLRPGDWFTVGAGDIIDLDVLIGERPGGTFNAFLMIQKKGETYPNGHPATRQVNGQAIGQDAATSPTAPVLPIFQVAPYATPDLNDPDRAPVFATGFPIWKCYQ
jgi:hypothetical protein